MGGCQVHESQSQLLADVGVFGEVLLDRHRAFSVSASASRWTWDSNQAKFTIAGREASEQIGGMRMVGRQPSVDGDGRAVRRFPPRQGSR